MNGMIFDIKDFALHDGPGPRVTVFMKGCPLRCKWCHNPEGLVRSPQLMVKHNLCTGCGRCRNDCKHEECRSFGRCIHACPNGALSVSGKEYSVEELSKILLKNADFYALNGGGVTFSGGEPLMQWEFLSQVIDTIGCHTAIETSGYVDEDIFRQAVDKTDFMIMDLKIVDRELHKKYTGVYNDIILRNFEYLKNSGRKCVIRTPLIPKICDTGDNLASLEQIIGSELKWEKLPYNEMAGIKYDMLGMAYDMKS